METKNQQKSNRLSLEQSPYLLQHAANPIDWYPWGEEAFAKAKAEDKPIFLSIGYSTCHWCHVMAEESFEDQEVAAMMNQYFVAIKVDREERPDIDAVYMSVAQALTGHGGWPLTIFMTPEQEPFLAGTYFPKYSRGQMPGLLSYLALIHEKWVDDKKTLSTVGAEITSLLQRQAPRGGGVISADLIEEGVEAFKQSFDPVYGGFGGAPKFPSAHQLLFLMRYSHLKGDQAALAMVEKTLTQLYCGGIFDHIGGGFSRYATDKRYLVPHFEKMLYDNGLLVMAYTEAYQLTGKDFYADVAKRCLDYVLREMQDPEGGFYSAQDADSQKEEGQYYIFTQAELLDLLGEEEGAYFNDYYHVTEEGNFEGQSILNRLPDQAHLRPEAIVRLSEIVYHYRLERMPLHKDDKCLTAWNGLMIGALAKAGQVFGEVRYQQAAKKGLVFLETHLQDERGRLAVSYRKGRTTGQGHLDDYAFVIWALLNLYEATLEVEFLEKALGYNDHLLKDFWDQDAGGFYMNGSKDRALIYNPKEWYDGAMPSGNSVAAFNLLKLAELTGRADLQAKSEEQLQAFVRHEAVGQMGFGFFLLALTLLCYPTREIVAVLSGDSESLDLLLQGYSPNTAVLVKTAKNADRLQRVAPFTKDYPLQKEDQYYICSNHSCTYPTGDLAILAKKLQEGVF